MAEQKNFIDLDLGILAHKFTCPYYSEKSEGVLNNPKCGAEDSYHQPENCSGDCWYMKHFKELLKSLQRKAHKKAQ